MKLLLHTCCAPCAIYPVQEARKDDSVVTGFFYNPNIHPYSEYSRRRKEVERYYSAEGLEIISPEYDTTDFFRNIAGGDVAPGRCSVCWAIRLESCASFAAENGFDTFTTTLLVSPHQNHGVLKKTCVNISKKKKVNFYYKDFRIGFKDAHKLAKEKGMYCQNYCGCIFSMVEREEKRKTKN